MALPSTSLPLTYAFGPGVAERNGPQKHVWRTRITPLSANDHGAVSIMRLTNKAETCVCHGQEHFMPASIVWGRPTASRWPITVAVNLGASSLAGLGWVARKSCSSWRRPWPGRYGPGDPLGRPNGASTINSLSGSVKFLCRSRGGKWSRELGVAAASLLPGFIERPDTA